ncbi:thiamine pyrophosphate-binding protein [Halomarina litorea]|uniref:thiamine pyrophosphate-binding protein n=1 Tax=Halomarina litorea TaxID=2961595 RepID=UPI0020C3AB60|nr:thiamine pyrophosphate-binding protein [Halomarina sp. BCD28]
MRVGEAVVAALADEGIDAVFGIPGKQTLPLNQAMADHGIRYVVARHETAVSHQAWGYAETTGRPAATVVIPGPGDMNAMNGLKNALNDCTPLVHVAVETDPDVRGGDGIHETPPETYDTVVKANYTVETPQGAAATVRRAVEEATTHPKGPVRVGIPKGFLPRTVTHASSGERTPSDPAEPSESAVEAATDLLAGGDAPVVLAGGGVRASDAADDLRAFAEHVDAPVATTYKGKGVLPEDHPLSAGVLCGGTSPDLAALLEGASPLVAVGTDFDAVATGKWRYDLPDDLIHVTYHADDVGTGYDPAVAVVADAGATLRALTAAAPARDADGSDRAGAVREADAARLDELVGGDGPLTSVAALRAVREALPREAVVAVDAGGFRIWTLVSFPAYDERGYVNPGSWATMGTGLPSAVGAKVADPDREVVALTGDGGLMMCVHELHTLAAEDIDVTVVVFTNHDYAIISEEASRSYGLDDGAYGWDEASIDFVALARSMGLDAVRATDAAGIESALADARASDAPTLVEVPTDPTEPQASEWMSN